MGGEEVGWSRYFHALDGFGLKDANEEWSQVGIVTGGDSLSVEKRFKEGLKLYLYGQ